MEFLQNKFNNFLGSVRYHRFFYDNYYHNKYQSNHLNYFHFKRFQFIKKYLTVEIMDLIKIGHIDD